jgi:hypothetical protein
MGYHPVNLAFRFLLEIATLAAMFYWGWSQHDGLLRIILAVSFPVIAAIIWGTFAVPDDPSRSGKAPVPVPGAVRLLLELFFFGIGAGLLIVSGKVGLGIALSVSVLIHYAVSYDRVRWLLEKKPADNSGN